MAGISPAGRAYIVGAAVSAALAVGLAISVAQARALRHDRAHLAVKAERFDSFCRLQRFFIGDIRDQLRIGSATWQDVAIREFDAVFVDQYSTRSLIACLGDMRWDMERAEACSLHKDSKCMIDIATQTVGLLAGSDVGGADEVNP